MEARADTSSGRFVGQWAFLSNPPPPYGHTRSLPPSSSYLRSDHSGISPLPTGLQFQQLNASRSSLPRNLQTPSVGGHSSTTIPSPPVLIPAHSANAADHLHPRPRPPPALQKPSDTMSKRETPPAIHEFSIQGILAAIQEEIEPDIDAIAEILGRSRLVLADQHESHLPPQGEIRAIGTPLQAVEEASSSSERLAADDVLIIREDASVQGGSHAGSAAYGLLERLQAMPRTRRMRSDLPPSPTLPRASTPVRNNSSPAVFPDPQPSSGLPVEPIPRNPIRISSHLLNFQGQDDQQQDPPTRSTNAVVSETYLSAGAGGVMMSDPPIVSESGRHYPLYSYDESQLFEAPPAPVQMPPITLRQRIQGLLTMTTELQNLRSWVQGGSKQSRDRAGAADAELQLRTILQRQRSVVAAATPITEAPTTTPNMFPEEQDLYD